MICQLPKFDSSFVIQIATLGDFRQLKVVSLSDYTKF